MVPYYMFVERDTGAKAYFEVPLARAYKVFTEAYSQVAGLCRTVRGPSMSALPGKVLVDGITEVGGREGVCAEIPAGPRSQVGQPGLFREVRPEGHLGCRICSPRLARNGFSSWPLWRKRWQNRRERGDAA